MSYEVGVLSSGSLPTNGVLGMGMKSEDASAVENKAVPKIVITPQMNMTVFFFWQLLSLLDMVLVQLSLDQLDCYN
jgi:hypothetical protein